ncbi:MAG: SIS domain-containing protein [Candidatus Liptonbacteria bacterium]|nr:SIS domain-containing protein [Candidatus Liptonbacteria bacterium]
MNHLEKNISEFGKQLSEKNIAVANLEKLSGLKTDGIVVIGIGGSARPGEMIGAVKKEIGLNIPVVVWKDYGLPDLESMYNIKKPFYICVSFSGDTEEPLSGFKLLLKKKGARFAAVTSGGELKKMALENNVPLAYFEAGYLTPRQSLGIMFYGLTKLLKATGLNLKIKDFSKEADFGSFRNKGKKIASSLKDKIVLIYTDEQHRHLGYIWKIKLNETAKNPAFNNVLPEMDHNEITSFDGRKFNRAAIFIESARAPRLEKKFKLTEKLLKERGTNVIALELSGRTEIEKAWNMMVLADWTSYFLAKFNGVPEGEFNISNPKIVIALKKLMG